jgi:carboxymethylenebutenolidase
LPGYDEATKEIVRRFAANGYLAICPNLYSREAPGASADDASATVRALGGVPDDRFVEDARQALNFLTTHKSSNGKVACIGFCSGGRQSVLAACSLQLDAAVDCYGGFVVSSTPDEPGRVQRMSLLSRLTNLSCPLLGLFGADDKRPSPDETEILKTALEEHNKEFEFHTYEGAGHAFLATDRPSYRPEAANDAWTRIMIFFSRLLS